MINIFFIFLYNKVNKCLKKKVTIIIPAFNEKNYINEIIGRVKNNINFEKQIIVIDDCSSDGTREILKKIKYIDKIIFHKKNLGKGAAIKSAIPFIKGNIVAIQDADLEYNPIDLNKLINVLVSKDLNVVYGSRVLGRKKFRSLDQNINFSKNFRILGNYLLTKISNFLNNQSLTDVHTCYKIFRKKIFFELNIKEKGFSFCPEVTTKLAKLSYKIIEVPIHYNGREIKDGKKIRFTDAISALKTIFKYKYFD